MPTASSAIGAASADDPLGPYTALAQPIVPATTVGLIDAHAFTANGASYLLWKDDGNAQSAPTPIRARQLSADGLSLTGPTVTLITNTLAWEDNLVEGPWVTRARRQLTTYSTAATRTTTVATRSASARDLAARPVHEGRSADRRHRGEWVGPGHNSVVTGPGGDIYLVYHAWQAGHVNGPGDSRKLLVDRIVWRDGWPVVPGAPSTGSRPLP